MTLDKHTKSDVQLAIDQIDNKLQLLLDSNISSIEDKLDKIVKDRIELEQRLYQSKLELKIYKPLSLIIQGLILILLAVLVNMALQV